MHMALACLRYDSLTKKNQNTNSTWSGIIFDFPQGSVLEPLLLNVFLADFFAVNYINIVSSVDGNTPYRIADYLDDLITFFEQASNGLFECFKNKKMLETNADKCHLLFSTNDRIIMNVDGLKKDKSNTEKLFGK